MRSTAKQDNDLLNWSLDLKYAHEATIREKTAAVNDYTLDGQLGLTDRKTFAAWVLDGNGQLFSTALNRENEIQSKINQLQLQLNGPKSGALKIARDNLAKARSDITSSPG